MRLETRARAIGRKVAEHTWLVALRNLVIEVPPALADLEVERDRAGTLRLWAASVVPASLDASWWRDLEVQLAAWLPRSDPQEAELLARVISELPQHRRRAGILRRLAAHAAGVAARPPPAAPRRGAPRRTTARRA